MPDGIIVPKYELGTIIRDLDWEDEYLVIVEIRKLDDYTICYYARNLNDTSNKIRISEMHLDKYYEEA